MGEHVTEALFEEKTLPPGLCVSASSVTGTRPYQEDCLMYQVLEDGVLGVVCDGMGGLSHGEVSSACAVDQLSAYFAREPRRPDSMVEYLKNALCSLDMHVAELKNAGGRPLKGGTTIVTVFIQGNRMSFASVGDSMIYLIRRGTCRELVRMHNYKLLLTKRLEEQLITREEYEEELSQGEALVSYLGMDGLKLMDCSEICLEQGDRILLCSDGLYKGLSREQIGQIVEQIPEEEFEHTALLLIREILNGPPRSLDNISVLCFAYHGQEETERPEKEQSGKPEKTAKRQKKRRKGKQREEQSGKPIESRREKRTREQMENTDTEKKKSRRGIFFRRKGEEA